MRIVNPGPDPVYTALSYRWGKQAYDASFQPFDKSGELRDPSALPQLISDALKVTKDLGFRYCWVDRYCIPQDDPRAMQIQLGHMDDIFRLATVTIVAVSDNDYLPGVSQKLNNVVQPLSMEGFEKSHLVHNPVEPYVVNIDSVEVELAEDKEFPFSEVRWKILDIPERGQIYVEVDLQGRLEHETMSNEQEVPGSTTGIVIPLAGDALAIILVQPSGSGTMERFGIIMLKPSSVFFRPYLLETHDDQDDLDDYDDSFEELSPSERAEAIGLPTVANEALHRSANVLFVCGYFYLLYLLPPSNAARFFAPANPRYSLRCHAFLDRLSMGNHGGGPGLFKYRSRINTA
ncbi:hypothetical protein CEP52_013139 [Fusarium oligoseptatum]|uniref:Heterokaryon incompatibility domain-containing protein n=1 Tax=Fusarium oligoseptatum TaxID=2604345 RepID=A0A428SV03_9HYPO|nr:hypothetical protein CEP52_013139 [Fusarium oligoseptatum]